MYRPVVKFRNINPDVLKEVQEDETDSELGSGSDSEESDTESALPSQATVSSSRQPKLLDFEVDIDVDLNSPFLRDLVSDEPVVSEEAPESQPTSSTADTVTPDTEEVDWDF